MSQMGIVAPNGALHMAPAFLRPKISVDPQALEREYGSLSTFQVCMETS